MRQEGKEEGMEREKGIQIERKKIKTVFIFRQCVCLYKMKSTKKLLELRNEFSKAVGYTFKTQKSIALLYTSQKK